MEKKVGRNDPCPCGSGKKFKKCCEEKMSRKKINAQLFSDFNKNPNLENKLQKVSTLLKNVQPLVPPAKKPEQDDEKNPIM